MPESKEDIHTIHGIQASSKANAIRKVTGPNSEYWPGGEIISIHRDPHLKNLWTITVRW